MSLTVGDTRPILTGTCQSQTGATLTPANITGATLAIHLRKPSGSVVTKTGVIVSGTAGTWSYTWLTGDLDVEGNWTCEVQVTFSDGSIETFGPTKFNVAPQLA